MQEATGRDDVDGLVAQMIAAAVLAGAYRELMRELPATVGGFTKLADKHSARVAALAAEICRTASLAGPAVAGVPSRRA